MKKILIFLICLCVSAGLLVGCGDGKMDNAVGDTVSNVTWDTTKQEFIAHEDNDYVENDGYLVYGSDDFFYRGVDCEGVAYHFDGQVEKLDEIIIWSKDSEDFQQWYDSFSSELGVPHMSGNSIDQYVWVTETTVFQLANYDGMIGVLIQPITVYEYEENTVFGDKEDGSVIRGVHWGMTEEEVRSIESSSEDTVDPPIEMTKSNGTRGDTVYTTNGLEYYGLSCEWIGYDWSGVYMDSNKELYMGVNEITLNFEATAFETLSEKMRIELGDPVSADIYDGRDEEWIWRTKNSEITLLRMSDAATYVSFTPIDISQVRYK